MNIKLLTITFIAIITGIFLACADAATNAQTNKVKPAQTPQVVNSNKPIIGFNQNWSYFPPLTNEKMMQNIKRFAPEMIRYPGGTLTHDSWDWKAGMMLNKKSRQVHPIEDVKTLADATGAKIIFDLDVVNHTLENQIEMLDAFRKLGVSIEYVELGNELYFNKDNYPEKFPTGAEYAKLVNEWTPKIKAAFPKAKVAALLFGKTVKPSNKRMFEWNSQVVSNIKTNLDAFTYHVYIPKNGNFEATKTDFQNVVKATDTGAKELWITEYGNMHPNTAADYLSELEKLADFIETFPKVTIALNHQIQGGEFNKLSKDGNDITPEGELYIKRAEARKAR